MHEHYTLTSVYTLLLNSKHVFVPNFCNMDCGYVEITPDNKHLIESCYEARTEKELPVLVQYIDRTKLEAPKATQLDVILYSREQIIKENEAMGNEVRALCNTKSVDTIHLFKPFQCTHNRIIDPRHGCSLGHYQCEGPAVRLRAAHATHHDYAQQPRQGARRKRRAPGPGEVQGVSGLLEEICRTEVNNPDVHDAS